jgi:hypothetical protein
LLKDVRERQAVATAEQLADGSTTETVRTETKSALYDACHEREEEFGGDWELMSIVPFHILDIQFAAEDAEYCAAAMADAADYSATGFTGLKDELIFEQAEFVRDIFGNPFRTVAFDPQWRSADAIGLARGIYDDRAFDRLPLLADALMDAGCNDEQVLSHCRSDGPHVRGCWVVDLVLGKE